MIDQKTLQGYLTIVERARDMAGQTGGADAGFNPVYGLCLVIEGLIRHDLDSHASMRKARQAKPTGKPYDLNAVPKAKAKS